MNIEKTISEQAVSDILTPMLESQDRIVTEDVAPLFDEATGLDTPPASGTVTTTIEESRNLISAIIRTAWTATLTMLGGASVISYIAAAYTYLRQRLQGNETYGIPDRRSEISASSPLAANLALLNDRKISEPNAIDGMSLARLMMDSTAATMDEIEDTIQGWTLNRAWPHSLFPNVETMTVGVGRIEEMRNNVFTASNLKHLYLPVLKYFSNVTTSSSQAAGSLMSGTDVETITIPEIEEIHTDVNGGSFIRSNVLKEVYMESLTDIRCSQNSWTYRPYSYASPLFRNCPALKKVVTNIEKVADSGSFVHSSVQAFWGSHNLRYFKFGTLKSWDAGFFYQTDGQMLDFIHLEIGAGTAISLNLQYWNPTNALDASRTDLIEEGSTAQNNLQQFLSNFRSYIADKLKGGYPIGQGPILTLSQAVHNAITAAEDDYHIREIITQKGWTISPAPN